MLSHLFFMDASIDGNMLLKKTELTNRPLLPSITFFFENEELENNNLISYYCFNKQYSNANNLECIPPSSITGENILLNGHVESQKCTTRKMFYGKGPEIERLRNVPHFREPYENLEMFIRLGKPDKATINEIGEKYNEYFHDDIKNKICPKFGRDQKRNKSLAIWFFEDNKHIIIPWLEGIVES